MSERDDLAKLLFVADNSGALDPELEWRTAKPEHQDYAYILADAILAAGYRKPRTIPDAHLLSATDGSYPVDHRAGTIAQSADGSVWRFDEGAWDNLGWGSAALRGPATVLYEPTA